MSTSSGKCLDVLLRRIEICAFTLLDVPSSLRYATERHVQTDMLLTQWQ